MNKNDRSVKHYIFADIIHSFLLFLPLLLASLLVLALVFPGREDGIYLTIWLAFPPVAFAAARLHSLAFRVTPVEPEPLQPDELMTFVPSTYGYYPIRKGTPPPKLPQPAVTTRKKDRLLATLALVCGICGSYLPLTGFYAGIAAILLANPVRKRGDHFYRRAATAWFLGFCCLIQTVLYFAAAL